MDCYWVAATGERLLCKRVRIRAHDRHGADRSVVGDCRMAALVVTLEDFPAKPFQYEGIVGDGERGRARWPVNVAEDAEKTGQCTSPVFQAFSGASGYVEQDQIRLT